MDGRPTIFVSGFGHFPTGPSPPLDPMKAKAKARWKLLARFLKGEDNKIEGGSDADLKAVSVRRHSTFNLFPCEEIPAPSESIPPPAEEGKENVPYQWLRYRIAGVGVHMGESVLVRQRMGGKVTLADMKSSFATGVDNTGNVCLWPAEEVMLHYLLEHSAELDGKHVCELGAGVGLAGLALGVAANAKSLLLTDGNEACVANLKTSVEANRAAPGGFAAAEVSARLLVWSERLSTLDVPRGGAFDLVVAADCLFFKDFHAALVHTLQTLLADSGRALLFAPLRGDTLDRFCQAAKGKLEIKREERYNEAVWAAHQAALQSSIDSAAAVRPGAPALLPLAWRGALRRTFCAGCRQRSGAELRGHGRPAAGLQPKHPLPGAMPAQTVPTRAACAPCAAGVPGAGRADVPRAWAQLLLTVTKVKKKKAVPPAWASSGHIGGSGCPCCKGRKQLMF